MGVSGSCQLQMGPVAVLSPCLAQTRAGSALTRQPGWEATGQGGRRTPVTSASPADQRGLRISVCRQICPPTESWTGTTEGGLFPEC